MYIKTCISTNYFNIENKTNLFSVNIYEYIILNSSHRIHCVTFICDALCYV